MLRTCFRTRVYRSAGRRRPFRRLRGWSAWDNPNVVSRANHNGSRRRSLPYFLDMRTLLVTALDHAVYGLSPLLLRKALTAGTRQQSWRRHIFPTTARDDLYGRPSYGTS